MGKDSEEQSELYQSILTGDAARAVEITQAALASGEDPQRLIDQQMIPAMDEAGHQFEHGDFFVPELLIAARAMKSALALVRPRLAEKGAHSIGKVVIGTVKGDLHDIGKGLVASMLEGGGFEVVDLGVDVAAENFVAAAIEHRAEIVGVSALLTTTMVGMQEVVDAVRASELGDRCAVMVGGAPLTQQFADSIGANGYSPNANAAVQLARTLIAKAQDSGR